MADITSSAARVAPDQRHSGRRWAAAFSAIGVVAVAATTAGVAASGATSPHRAAPAARAHAAKFLACEVTDTGGINDESFNQSAYAGATEAAAINHNITTTYLQSSSTSDYTPNIDRLLAKGCGIIVTVGFDMANNTSAAAKANPKAKFAIVDFPSTQKNLLGLTYETNQDAFLGGYLAAAMSKSGVVGTFGGQEIPPVTIYMNGWVAGVRYYDKVNHAHVTALGYVPAAKSAPGLYAAKSGEFTNNFTDQTLGATITKAEMAQGADVIFPVAGAVGLGAAQAVKSAGAGHYMEWVDTDGCLSAKQYCSLFLTSVTKGIATSVRDAVLSAYNGTFHGGNYTGTLKNGGVALSPYHDFAHDIPAKVKAAIASLKARIIAGKINLDPNAYPAS